MKKLIIVSEQKSFIKRPLSHDAILGQEKEFLEHGRDRVEICYKNILLKGLNKILGKVKIAPICDSFTSKKRTDAVYLYIAMSVNYLKSNLYLLKNLQKNGNRIALYIWDCWQPEYDQWDKVLDDLRPDYIFWSFKQNWEFFKESYKNSYWIPQSANRYFFKSIDIPKTRKFIQMGRVNKPLHEKILSYLEKNGLADTPDNYAYRRKEKEALFPDLNELVEEINRSKYIVCIPKIYENPKRTGNICAMTGRYYESILCKTLIIGKKPLIFDEMFGKEGMIEFEEDLSDFDEKIDELERNEDKYTSIVNRNYENFMNHHTWGHRLDAMLEVIDGE